METPTSTPMPNVPNLKIDRPQFQTTKLIFRDGQEVHALHWPNDTQIEKGVNGIERIEVVMEPGQMAQVPWFVAWGGGKPLGKYNSAFVKFVTL